MLNFVSKAFIPVLWTVIPPDTQKRLSEAGNCLKLNILNYNVVDMLRAETLLTMANGKISADEFVSALNEPLT